VRTRGYGEGTIRRRGDGLWEARLRTESGKQRSFYGETKRAVQLKLLEARRDQDRGKVPGSSRLTVEKFLQRWLDDVARQRVRPQTFDRYREIVTVHLIPAAGRTQLDKLGPGDVQAMLNAKAVAGLSPRTVHHIRAVMRNAFNQALRWGLVLRNVAELVDPPRVPEVQRRTLSVSEVVRFLRSIRGDRLEAAYVVGLSLGLRIGEVLGLRWESIDLERGVLTVQASLQRVDGRLMLGELKTARSRRTLPLTSIAVAVLRSHRDRQLHEKVQPGPPWSGLVFTSRNGRPLDGSKVVQALQRVLLAAGLPRIRFHDLRHSCASLLFAQGVAAKTVQEILGHSRIGTTLDIYTHMVSEDQPVPPVMRDAADAMDRALVPASLPPSHQLS
jgi:integrase